MQGREWHRNAVANRSKISYTVPFVDANTGKLIVTISRAVLDSSGSQSVRFRMLSASSLFSVHR